MRVESSIPERPLYIKEQTETREFAPGSAPNFRNPMTGIDFPNHTQRYRPGDVRDRFGWLKGLVRALENLLRFFNLETQSSPVRGAHNPLVPGSSPGEPTISITFNSLLTS